MNKAKGPGPVGTNEVQQREKYVSRLPIYLCFTATEILSKGVIKRPS